MLSWYSCVMLPEAAGSLIPVSIICVHIQLQVLDHVVAKFSS
jgi:hypothetical protein